MGNGREPHPRPAVTDQVLGRITAKMDRAGKLSPRELDVLRAYAVGLVEPEIAVLYGISRDTVKTQAGMARLRLGAKNTTHAVALAIRAGLL